MDSFVEQMAWAGVFVIISMFLVTGIIWLLFNHGIDKLRHPEEWKNAGSSGERVLYMTLIREFGIPGRQILRNVYIPKQDGNTSEIDVLVVSRKGLFVFECKNYSGNIYGDARQQKWIQYVGSKKNYFYNPLRQNNTHVEHLRKYLVGDIDGIPVVSLVVVTSNGKWKIRNLSSDEHVLGYNCSLRKIYSGMSDSKEMAKKFYKILNRLTPLSRPGEIVKERHIEQVSREGRQ